MAKKLH